MVETGSIAPVGQQSIKNMHRVWESSSALIGAISTKIKGLSRASKSDSAGSQRRAHKALDSAKIQIRLLSCEGDLASITRIAESAEEPELASYAVSHLVEHDEAIVRPQLVALAESFSYASLPALISLFNSGEADLAHSILMRRLHKGDYFYLIQSKKARPLLLLDVLGAVDEFKNTNLCLEYFPKIWHCLADRPQDQEYLLAEILGDINPGGLRYSPDNNMVPQAVKIQAMQLLHAIHPPSYERSLWYASRDADDVVSYTATMACADYWQNEGAVPEQFEPFPMLNLNLLFYLSKVASTFQWRGPAGVMDLYQQWCKDNDELEAMDPRADMHAHAILQHRTKRAWEELKDITEQRLNALQPIVDAVTNSMGLPHAKIRSTDVAGVAAAYLVGTGTVEFAKTTLLDDKPLTEEFMSSMLHELGHMEQDVLIIRMIADEIGLQFGQHGHKLKGLFTRYADAIGYAPDSTFLLEVLRLRRDKPLTPSEKIRADRLLQAAYENMTASQSGKKITERIERLEESVAATESGSLDVQLLDCLRDERCLKPLFENGYVPAVLIDEMRNCRAKIEELLSAIVMVDAGAQRRGFSRKPDMIAVAQEIFAGQRGHELSPIMDRFRIVVSHMLAEEHRRLEKKLSEIRRAGYHEAEAYTISDRVEVIVKALRKGWYEFT